MTIQLSTTKVTVSAEWSPPENQNETVIDYYEVTLYFGSCNITETIACDTKVSLPCQFEILEQDYYNLIVVLNVTAVDQCGQRSEPVHLRSYIVTSMSSRDGLHIGHLAIALAILLIL